MIGIAVLVVLALVVLVALWSRFASSRLDRRSVEGYGRALDTLGGVARRSEGSVSLVERKPPEVALPHVTPALGAERHARPAPPPMTPMPRVRLRPPGPPGAMPVFSDLPDGDEASQPPLSPKLPGPTIRPVASTDDPTLVLPREGLVPLPTPDDEAPVAEPLEPPAAALVGLRPTVEDEEPLTMLVPVVPPEVADPAPPVRIFDAEEAVGSGAGGPVGPERSQRMRRAATGAAAAVAIGALGAGGWQLAVDGSHHPGAAATGGTNAPPSTLGHMPATHASGNQASGETRARGGTAGGSAAPSSTLQPTSSSSSLVAYQAPASRYTITFTVAGATPCWLGAQASPGGHYLWMQTLSPGQTATYSASGPVVIRIGAPPVVSVSVNGQKVALPPGNIQPYDISFTPANAA